MGSNRSARPPMKPAIAKRPHERHESFPIEHLDGADNAQIHQHDADKKCGEAHDVQRTDGGVDEKGKA